MSVINDLKTLSSNEVSSAQARASSHESIISSLESEVDKILASINAVSGRTFVESESLFSKVKAELVAGGKFAESEVEAIWAKIRGIL